MLINTTVFKDARGVCTSGYAKSVPADATLYTVETILLNQTQTPYCDETLLVNTHKNLLHIYTPQYGDLWVDETLDSWQAKVNSSGSASASNTVTQYFRIGTDVPAGLTFSSPFIKNVNIDVINLDSFPALNINAPYTAVDPGNPDNGLLDFTFYGGLSDGSILQLTVTPQ